MIRRYNYTGRKKLLSKRIKITEVVKGTNKFFEFKCDFNDFGFPDEAKIFVEPYFKSSFLRFDFGSIARFDPPTSTDISDLPATDQLWYRIKVVDNSSRHGLILGFADVQGTLANTENGGRQAILPVDFIDLGKRIWTLEFRASGPVLAVNSTIDNIREKVTSDDVFFSLVYPEIIKRVAFRITETDGFYENELSGWEADWMRFFKEVLMQTQTLIEGANEDTIEDWCNDMSDAFARKYKVIERYITQKT